MSFIVNPYRFAASGSPSASSIVVTANAEIEANSNDLMTTSGSNTLTSGVTGAHGRVYDNLSFLNSFTYPGGAVLAVSGGCRFYFRTDSTDSMLRFRNSAQGNHIAVSRVAGGTFRVTDSGNGNNYDSGSANVSLTTWFYCMLYSKIDGSVGEFIAKLFDASGVLIETLTQTGIDTYASGTLAAISAWGGSSGDTYIDHLWTDITGAFRGCGYVETLSPNAAGDNADWTRGGTNTGANYSQVNESPKNTTSYVFSTAADQVDLYNFADRSQAGTPITVQQVLYAHAHSAGTRQYKPICKIGGVIYEGSTQTVTSTSTTLAPVLIDWPNNPATGLAWDDTSINGAQFGVKSVTTDVRLQCVALQVLVSI